MIGADESEELPPAVSVRLDETVATYTRRRLEQHTKDRYAGLELQKFPEDLRVYEHLLWASRANVVIEIGTLHGASALWFRDRLRTFSGYGRIAGDYRVISVDIDHTLASPQLDSADPSWRERITLVTGDVTDPAVAAQVREMLEPNDRCFVVEDSAHVAETTGAALEHFAELVPVGGYFVVEDGVVDVDELRFPEYPRGVLPALDAWLGSRAGSAFARRRDLERYGVSCHPGGFLQRVSESRDAVIGAELRRELESPPAWMYAWPLSGGVSAPAEPVRVAVHETREHMVLDPIRQITAEAGSAASAIDLGCNEGWFSQLALREGIAHVVGVDVREANIRRAELLREHYAVDTDRLEFIRATIFDLDPAELGQFDLVLMLGLVYHLENPGGALRLARQLAKPGAMLIVESQLTRQDAPITHGWGIPDQLEAADAGFAARLEADEDDPLASSGGVVSLIPNRAALEMLTRAAGFEQVEWLEPPAGAEAQFAAGDRGIVVARTPAR